MYSWFSAAVIISVFLPVYQSLHDCDEAAMAVLACAFYYPASLLCWNLVSFMLEELWDDDKSDVPDIFLACSCADKDKPTQVPA